MRRTTILAASAGIVAIAAAATLRFVVVPAQAQLPADTDTTRSYEGTVPVMLNASALAAADLANVVMRDIPVTLERTTTVTDVADGKATVDETALILGPDGSTLLGSEVTYVVDRKTMLAEGDRSGLVMGWPIGTEQRDYVGWSSDLQSEVELTYVDTQEFQGIDAYVFSSDVFGQIVDPAVLANFPATLPKFALPLVAQALDLSPEAAEGLQAVLPALPDEVPLGYWLTSQTTYFVDPATGMVLDLDRTEARSVAFAVDGVPTTPLADVFAISYAGTTDSVAATVAESQDNGSRLALYGTTLPIVLLVLGGLLLVVGLAAGRRPQPEVVVDLTSTQEKATAGR